ncbi:TRAP transporter large permease [Thioclava sp. BHET1]|uniref:TRAP transporter large permease protein n=1 Tax=Thioclava dalianensis TaxID=1185766 RepID=A0A074T8N6_9RHOB|nr:TRAP transporter large permease [Thioclava dalianensis]KEP68176.1 C4-dicarboxylate ABC transporter permease [Thioclava dalianensis]TMV91817.1 TRAP transporter large permease [Thioclava sp. BHET1]SFN86168.1 TRAP transporter, DctM subunit [Thioclava dalianensis]
MSDTTLGLSILGIMFVLLALRAPVWLALALCGIGGNFLISGPYAAKLLAGATPFDQATNYNLSVVPLFILMGEVATSSRLSSELFQAARVVFSGLRGGLAIATIGASGAFGTVCGSSVATAATMTRISLPEMRRAGFTDSFSTASIAAGGTLGILIPPSIILVIYSAIAELSLRKLFAAAFLPGVALAILYVLIALGVAALSRGQVPADPPASLSTRLKALAAPWQFLILFTVTIGGIYMGIFSPNEAAAIGAFGAILLGFVTRRLSFLALRQALRATAITSAMLFLIIIAATMFANFVVQTKLPDFLIAEAQAMGFGRIAVLSSIIVIYLVLGCFLEGIGMVLITVPVFLPVVTSFGYDPIWFGVIVVIVVEIGLISPPVGMNIFVIQAQFADLKLVDIYRGILPFLLAPLILILALFVAPQIALWLPQALY